MDKIVPLSHAKNYAFKFINYRERDMANEERYEGNIRSDFRSRKIPVYDSIEVIRIS